jgi:hypothetical protein
MAAVALCAFVACSTPPAAAPVPGRLPAPPAGPNLLFVSVANDDTFHHVALTSLSQPGRDIFVTPLTCERAYFGGRRGICLTSTTDGANTTWWAQIFSDRFDPLDRLPLTGRPSRVRISPDGHYAGATVFESGHEYLAQGFSTRTTLFDLEARTAISDLEQFETRRAGRPFKERNFNFWGVTFARDSDTFYATLDTGGVSYLVRGSIRGRSVDVLHPNVECPSLSPDNTRIAFKKRIGTRSLGWWQLAILSLDTLTETVVRTETRGVDDQVEWLDDNRVVYHLTGGLNAADLWAVAADNSADPSLILPAAYSPAVVR